MKSVNPQGNIYFCTVSWTNNYTDMLTFSNLESQTAYFNSIIKKSYSNYTYIKKSSQLKVEGNIDDLIMYNYLFYRNNGFTNKNYYCFITNMEYVSENVTLITFETDVWQTWIFDIQYNNCFIERWHVDDDEIGKYTIPEGLETGEYISQYVDKYGNGKLCYVLGSTANPQKDGYPNSYGGIYDGIYSGVAYYWYNSPSQLSNHLQNLADNNKISAVTSLFIAPVTSIRGWSDSDFGEVERSSDIYNSSIIQQDTIKKIDGYTPKNNKLFCYPYCYYLITNGVGASATLKPELFKNNICKIKVESCLTPGISIHYTPQDYAGVSDYFDAGISGGKFPQCNWATDQFTNWLTQNSVNIAIPDVQMALTPFSMLGDLMSLNIGGATERYTNNYLSVLQRDKEVETHAKVPPQAQGNLNSGDIATASDENGLNVYTMTIKQEFAKIIDDYFSMFGYKVNRIQKLKVTGRPSWNYVKTLNCNIAGSIPENDLNRLKQMFDTGGTFWHSVSTMYDYTKTNK